MFSPFLRFPRLPRSNHTSCRAFGRFDDEQDDDPQSWPDWRYWADVDNDFDPVPADDEDQERYLDWDDDTDVYEEPREDSWNGKPMD